MNETGVPRRVIKLGGSLLEREGLASWVRAWLARQPVAENLLVVGGGRLADVLSEADRLHGVGEEASHWLCVRAMQIHAELVASLLGEAVLVRSIRGFLVPRRRSPGLAVVDPWIFLHEEEPQLVEEPLPASWEVTSDSIAARLAQVVSAEELVLLKSALPPPPHTLAAAAAAGYVDRYLPYAAVTLAPVRSVNLADADWPQVRLQN